MTTKLSERLRGFALDASRHLRPQLVDQLRELVAQAEAQEKLAYFEGRVKPSSDDPETQAVGRMPDRGPEWCAEVKKRWREREARIMSRSQPNDVKPSRTLDSIDDLLEYIQSHKQEAQAGELFPEYRHDVRKPSQSIGEQTPAAWMYPSGETKHPIHLTLEKDIAEEECRDKAAITPLYRSPISPEARDIAIEALDKVQVLLNMNANSNEFYDRRAKVRPLVSEALSALRGEPGVKP